MKHHGVYILLLIVFCACSKELKVDFGEPSKKLVLYPNLTNNTRMSIKLSGVAGILSNSFPALDNPTVVITDNNVPVDTVTIDIKGNGYSKVIPLPEHEYSFKATAAGYPDAICIVKLPDPVIELSIDTSYVYFQYSKVLKARIRIKDDPFKNNYYKVTAKIQKYFTKTTRRINGVYVTYDSTYSKLLQPPQMFASIPETGFFFCPSLNSYFLAQVDITFVDKFDFSTKLGSEVLFSGTEFYFPDELFNGQDFIIDLIPGFETTSGSQSKYIFELSSISEDYYLGVKSYSRYGTKEHANLPVSEDVSIYSSVNGGYGFPMSSNTVIDSSYWMPFVKRPY
jgi:hypothetical protein